MSHSKRAAVLFLLFGLAACGGTATPASSRPAPTASRAALNPPVKVHLGDTPFAGMAALYLALDKGYFKDEGLDMELTNFTSSGDQLPGLTTGQLDVGTWGVDPALFNAVNRGIAVKIVSFYQVVLPNSKGLAIMVRKDLVDGGVYKEPKDFKGMNIGIASPTSSSALYLVTALAKGGLKRSDVNLITTPYPDMLLALTNRKLDAMQQTQPFVQQAEEKGLATTVFSAGDLLTGAPSNIVVYGSQFSDRQPEAAKRFVVALLRGKRDLWHAFDKGDGNKEEVFEAVMNHTPTKTREQALGLAAGGVFSGTMPNGEMPPQRLEEFQNFFIDSGTQNQRIELSKLVDSSYVDYAVSQLGRVS